ncbi:hypothetical protein AVEN_182711-1 [Araneus ventricosus]|uniref:Uncharacterized protein n=1 Tax=Araneus ventricosus TaxID=182803 RepID=A0A4Y2JZB9_ARAVE|nr:hypothetical protein AVEN_182711-1 [Araneus ventricosus]
MRRRRRNLRRENGPRLDERERRKFATRPFNYHTCSLFAFRQHRGLFNCDLDREENGTQQPLAKVKAAEEWIPKAAPISGNRWTQIYEQTSKDALHDLTFALTSSD